MYTLEEFQAFLDQAEKLLPQPLDVSLAACQSFLDAAELQLLPLWKEQVAPLRQEHDPRRSPDYQSINLMQILGIARKEQPHSCFIGWLLDPQGSHGLGDRFLKPFLQKAQEICQQDFELDLSAVRVDLERGSGRGRPDITVETPNCLCIVENKITAPEVAGQTQRYADDAEANAPDKHRLLVFLTSRGRMPGDERFNPMSYVQMLELLDSLAQSSLHPEEVRFAILQFITNIRETVLGEKHLRDRLIRLLGGYESKGDAFLIRNWSELSKTIADLEGETPMTKFEGFSEVALLYAEKYELVEAMRKQFDDERKALFVALRDKIASQDWYRPDTVQYKEGKRVVVGLFSDHIGEEILFVRFWWPSESFVANRMFRYRLLIGDIQFKDNFRREAGDFLRQEFSSKEYESLNDLGSISIIFRDVHYETGEILETMFAEIEKLRKLLPFAERAYQQSSS